MSNVDFSKITEGIYHVIETEEKILTGLQNDTITLKRNKQNRTIKQILGHLIDSASNNHQRMVRLQYSKDLLFFPDYRQDNDLWIALQIYHKSPKIPFLITVTNWLIYTKMLNTKIMMEVYIFSIFDIHLLI